MLTVQVLGAIGGSDQVLVFVHSRKETYKTGKFLKDTAMAAETLARFVKARVFQTVFLPSSQHLHSVSTPSPDHRSIISAAC